MIAPLGVALAEFSQSGEALIITTWTVGHCTEFNQNQVLRLPGTYAAIIDENQTPLARFPQ